MAVSAKTKEKRNDIMSLKHSQSEVVSQFEIERNQSIKNAKAASKAASAKDQLAKTPPAKLSKSTLTTKALCEEVLRENARCMELEEHLSEAMKWVPQFINKEWWGTQWIVVVQKFGQSGLCILF